MHYTSPTDLSELNDAIDRAQAMLDATLTDLEKMPPASTQYRLKALKQVIDCIYRLTSIRKTMIALRARPEKNASGLRQITGMVAALHMEMMAIRARAQQASSGGEGAPTPAGGGAGAPPTETPGCQPAAASSQGTTEIPVCPPPSPQPALNFSHSPQKTTGGTATPGCDASAPRKRQPKQIYSAKKPPTLFALIPKAIVPASLLPLIAEPPAQQLPKTATTPTGSAGFQSASDSQHATAAILHHHATNAPAPAPAPAPASRFELRNSSFTDQSRTARQESRTARLINHIATRIPYTVYTSPADLAYVLPPRSHRAVDYAPLLDLDIVPRVHAVPTLALNTQPETPAPETQLKTQIETHLAFITDTTINLRADFLLPKQPGKNINPPNPIPRPPIPDS